MFFLFSGEGPTDLGVCADGDSQCDAENYNYGPMTVIVSQIVELRHEYSLLDSECFGFVSKSALADRTSELKSEKKKETNFPGKKRRRETLHFFNNARVLARIAKERESELNDEVIAVLFRDSDGTVSSSRALWADKRQSMLAGFERERFSKGVPMIPKPISEAWVICAVKNHYEGCDKLEDRSGSKNSPNPLKRELKDYLGKLPGREELCQMVLDRKIDIQKIQMQSFKAFKERLEEVI